MSDSGPKKLPPAVLSALQAAQLRVQLAQEQWNHLCTRIEARFGVRMQGATVADDGTVTELPPPPAPEAPT